MKPWTSDTGSTGENKNNLSSMHLFGKDNPWRPVYVALSIYLGLGYSLYFIACLFVTPEWGRELMAWAMQTIKALGTAERINAIKDADPFPAQVVILYCAISTVVLTAWFAFWNLRSSIFRETILFNHQKLPKTKKMSRLRYLISGILIPILNMSVIYIFIFFPLTDSSWRERRFFSENFLSVSLFLIVIMVCSGAIALSILVLRMAFLKKDIFNKEI